MRSLRPLPVVRHRRGRLPRRRLALALALALLAAAPGPGAPAWSPEEDGLRAADNEYRAPGGGRVRLARWQPAAGPGGCFMGRIAHDMDRDSKTGHAGREAVPCWLGDNRQVGDRAADANVGERRLPLSPPSAVPRR